ncbi:MAG: hypothetical protein HC880_02430, partial [Bacteroidia bacterium]|nr:hypothetical protein [Bacteroidia bacterium]
YREKYREANQQLAHLQKGENRVVFLGNSITEGWVKSRPEIFLKKMPT